MVNNHCSGREALLQKAHSAYIDYIRHCKRLGQSKRTFENKRCNLWLFHQWLQVYGIASPLQVTTSDLEAFLHYLSTEYQPKGKNVCKGTVSRYVGLLKSFYSFLHKEKLIHHDPAVTLRHPRLPKKIPKDILTPDEFKSLLNSLSSETALKLRDAVTVRILMFSGIRISELCKLDVEHLNLKKRELILKGTKNKNDRIAFIDVSTQKWLAQYLISSRPALVQEENNSLIVSNTGTRMLPTAVQRLVKKYVNKANINKLITPHSFRRTLCSLLLQSGLNLKVIASIAGHLKLSSTAKYSQIDIETLAQVYKQGHPLA